ncbi:tRNA(His) guanylyltransferase Thg1 family protein [Desmospora profundinema]|uniref:tRNA(His) 5'-end guanylyltransferase n=1 Tax=Desmospora profundinema TaxID=1571184 RepID=A0ABU1IN85_9BACL|nr:tRNA(His) guanylyltransferase Thg1 family protein [Desmospora profundinema]MDR6226161.1 tRNA(His) 5'-end guanylyltransferase [Desmospora profundinema]
MDSLGTRMKGYEHTFRHFLPKRMPVIIRVDGRAFHTYTEGMERPFDERLHRAMTAVARDRCENIMGCKLAYVQSDEISLLLTNYEKLTTQSWFNNNIQKMVSVSASMATARFNDQMYPITGKLATFDSRIFALPKEEVTNYFYWRQADVTKNSIQMVARAHFTHEECSGLTNNQLQEKLFTEKGVNWNDFPTHFKRGACGVRQIPVTPAFVMGKNACQNNRIGLRTMRSPYLHKTGII